MLESAPSQSYGREILTSGQRLMFFKLIASRLIILPLISFNSQKTIDMLCMELDYTTDYVR
jgi:hypothetical protein